MGAFNIWPVKYETNSSSHTEVHMSLKCKHVDSVALAKSYDAYHEPLSSHISCMNPYMKLP
jgi:hypothetical protein